MVKILSIILLSVLFYSEAQSQQSGVLIIHRSPFNTRIAIDGKDIGNRDTLFLPTGKYRIHGYHKGHAELNDTIAISVGDTLNYYARLEAYMQTPAFKNSGFKNVKAIRIFTITSVGTGVISASFLLSAFKKEIEKLDKESEIEDADTDEERAMLQDEYNQLDDSYRAKLKAAKVMGITCGITGLTAILMGEYYKSRHPDDQETARFEPFIGNHGSALSIGMTYKF